LGKDRSAQGHEHIFLRVPDIPLGAQEVVGLFTSESIGVLPFK